MNPYQLTIFFLMALPAAWMICSSVADLAIVRQSPRDILLWPSSDLLGGLGKLVLAAFLVTLTKVWIGRAA